MKCFSLVTSSVEINEIQFAHSKGDNVIVFKQLQAIDCKRYTHTRYILLGRPHLVYLNRYRFTLLHVALANFQRIITRKQR